MIDAIAREDGFLRLADGEDLVAALGRLAVESAVILAGIGMVRDAAIGYWNGTQYGTTRLDEPAELLSLQGNIARHGQERIVHAHLCIAGADGVARGGHLMAATVHNTAEIALRLAPEIVLERIEEDGRLVLRPRLRAAADGED